MSIVPTAVPPSYAWSMHGTPCRFTLVKLKAKVVALPVFESPRPRGAGTSFLKSRPIGLLFSSFLFSSLPSSTFTLAPTTNFSPTAPPLVIQNKLSDRNPARHRLRRSPAGSEPGTHTFIFKGVVIVIAQASITSGTPPRCPEFVRTTLSFIPSGTGHALSEFSFRPQAASGRGNITGHGPANSAMQIARAPGKLPVCLDDAPTCLFSLAVLTFLHMPCAAARSCQPNDRKHKRVR